LLELKGRGCREGGAQEQYSSAPLAAGPPAGWCPLLLAAAACWGGVAARGLPGCPCRRTGGGPEGGGGGALGPGREEPVGGTDGGLAPGARGETEARDKRDGLGFLLCWALDW